MFSQYKREMCKSFGLFNQKFGLFLHFKSKVEKPGQTIVKHHYNKP
jgi:hypothetical protein